MTGTTRISLSLPTSIVEDIKFCSDRIGVSRSAFVADLLQDVNQLAVLLRALDLPDANESLRLRGDSAEILRQRIADLRLKLDEATGHIEGWGGSADGDL